MTGVEAAKSFQRGEEKGFNYFFYSLYYQLFVYAYHILGNKELAEDMVEEAFIKIWNTHHTFRQHHPKVIQSWLYTTVKNGCLNKVASDKRWKKEEVDAIAGEPDLSPSSEENMIRAGTKKMLQEAIDIYLPTECGRIIKLLYFEELSVKEAANLLSLSINTIKNQESRGLSFLKKRFLGKEELLTAEERNKLRGKKKPFSEAWVTAFELRNAGLKFKEISKRLQVSISTCHVYYYNYQQYLKQQTL